MLPWVILNMSLSTRVQSSNPQHLENSPLTALFGPPQDGQLHIKEEDNGGRPSSQKKSSFIQSKSQTSSSKCYTEIDLVAPKCLSEDMSVDSFLHQSSQVNPTPSNVRSQSWVLMSGLSQPTQMVFQLLASRSSVSRHSHPRITRRSAAMVSNTQITELLSEGLKPVKTSYNIGEL